MTVYRSLFLHFFPGRQITRVGWDYASLTLRLFPILYSYFYLFVILFIFICSFICAFGEVFLYSPLRLLNNLNCGLYGRPWRITCIIPRGYCPVGNLNWIKQSNSKRKWICKRHWLFDIDIRYMQWSRNAKTIEDHLFTLYCLNWNKNSKFS